MPVMDGRTATREIRKVEMDRGWHPTPIIALTAHATREASEESLALGCNTHLTKPIRKQRLLDTIARLGRVNTQ
ncbi:MAG: response regulator [Magnetococcus sp. THC-1_WYH]